MNAKTKKKIAGRLLEKGIFFHTRTPEKWVETLTTNPDLRFKVLPQIINTLRFKNHFSEAVAEGYKEILASNDKDGWYMVVSILANYKYKKKKRR